MQLSGLVTVQPEQTKTIDKLASMMGVSFLEEPWTEVWLESLDAIGTTDERKLEISRAIMKYDFTVGAPHECCYMLPNFAAGAGAYLSSDLEGRIWNDLEDEAIEMMANAVLTEAEKAALFQRADEMEGISNFKWMVDETEGEAFIHFFSLGVNRDMRGSGAFRRLMTPFLEYADAHGINCYLECYSDHLESLYGHFGFRTVHRFRDPAFSVYERAMVREPR
ncbi:GNAT family N-acetyltransferase [Raoultibacter phocaeensis]|uniref:GNAT family N-acetyltransferase n=1 Tax=Raoultibacter phocaeensis TaxID=2479841 RepID=UPI00111AF29F|nr:GNAT family N-acetyltransferase [Raoultibacter phocaeensis]